MSSTTTLDLTECRMARATFQFALDRHKPKQAARVLAQRYLPALRDLVAGTDPEQITAALDTLAARLEKGSTMTDDPLYRDEQGQLRATYVYEGEEADDLFDALTDDYCIAYEAWCMQFEGTPKHPAAFLMARVERIGA